MESGIGPEKYQNIRQKEPEYPHTGQYNLHFEDGTYSCGACGEPLFESGSKFDGHCGWPSFDKSIPGKVEYAKDTSHKMLEQNVYVQNASVVTWDTFLMTDQHQPASDIV